MSGPLLAIVGLIYLAVAVSYYIEGRPWMSLVLLGWATSNFGLIADGMKP